MRLNSFKLAILRKQLRPFRLHWFARLGSTNDCAAAMRRRGEMHAPAVVLTSRQIHGRGRGENIWISPAGSLTATFVVPAADHLRPHQVPLIAGLAVRNALAEVTGIDRLQLKWPNDLLYQDRKVGGLLCERIRNADLIGVGINANVPPSALTGALRTRSASILEMTGQPVDLNILLAAIAQHLHVRLSRRNEHHFGAVLREYHRHHALVGRRIEVGLAGFDVNAGTSRKSSKADTQPIVGVCVGLDTVGRLLLREGRQDSRMHRVVAGSVVLR